MLKERQPRFERGRTIRRAFDVVAEAQRVSTMEALEAAFGSSFRALGFDVHVGLSILASGGRPDHAVMFGATDRRWEQHYAARGYARHDAVLRELVRATEPIAWSDLPERRPLSAEEHQIYAEAADFGLRDGFVTPIPHLDGSLSAVLLTGPHVEAQDIQVRAIAHLLSLHYGSIARRIRQAAQSHRAARGPHLSRRQIECLKWTRHGKSSTDIGDILGISADTVDEHLAGACARLGVRTRVQAAVEAVLMGLLD